MTRNQRRRKAKALALVRQRQAIVRSNLSVPLVVEHVRGSLVSDVYGNRLDRARGRGVTPMSRGPHDRIISRSGDWRTILV